jgi:hypothetical protein
MLRFLVPVFRSRAIEEWRGVVRSMPVGLGVCEVYLRSTRIHIWDMWRVHIRCVYVVSLTWRIGWSIGVRYI